MTLARQKLACSALLGERPQWALASGADHCFLDWTQRHGLDALLDASGAASAWPEEVAGTLRRRALAWAAWDLRHTAFLQTALATLAEAGIESLIFKGTAVAWRHYPSAHLRPRSDTDLLVRPEDRMAAAHALERLGWRRSGSATAAYVSYECSFTMQEAGLVHMIDLHWRIHYSQAQSRRLPLEALMRRGQPLPALSPWARATADADSAILACMHRSNDMNIPQWTQAGPTLGADRLIWLHDLHLLLNQMTTQELDALSAAAVEGGAASACEQALRLTATCFHNAGAARVALSLVPHTRTDTVRRYQEARPWRQRWMDFAALPDLVSRSRYLAEHLSPDPAYLRDRYGDAAHQPLALLKARRVVDGLRRWAGMESRK